MDGGDYFGVSDGQTRVIPGQKSACGKFCGYHKGDSDLGVKKLRRRRLVRRKGGITTSGEVTSATTVLVRGDSSVWAYGDHGTKERAVAQLIRKGASISVIPDTEFRKLLEQRRWARISDRVAGEPILWVASATQRQFKEVAKIEGPLDREHTHRGRVEQSYLRSRLFGTAEEATCSLCGRRLPVNLLVAAHVKPRSECLRRERLDAQNIVASMCLLGCDALYERGLIAVSEGGKIRVTAAHSSRVVKAALRRFREQTCDAWNSSNALYFKWHLQRRFQGPHSAS
jgi:hypothetical protein